MNGWITLELPHGIFIFQTGFATTSNYYCLGIPFAFLAYRLLQNVVIPHISRLEDSMNQCIVIVW